MADPVAYNVAFRYTNQAGGFAGVITWTSYSSKEEFDAQWAQRNNGMEEIVEEGITAERAMELASSTLGQCRMNAILEEHTGPDGAVNYSGALRTVLEYTAMGFIK